MGNRLLLADDSITIQKVVAIIFANEEFELTVVDNGTSALQKARELRPDVMLVDALMPGKTGYEVCAEIRRDSALSTTPILLLIGAFEPFDEAKARDCGADASISKPFESQQLIDRVKELLEMGKSRAAAPVPTPAKPVPVESAAEELWGDLSSFDTMPPAVAAPVAPAPAAPVAQAAPAAPAPIAPAAALQQAPPAVEEIVEVSADDDLWGAFELEEAPPAAVAAPAAVFGIVEPEAEFEAEEFFTFDDESETVAETGPALDLADVEEPVALQSAEDMFSFADVEPQEAPARPETAPLPEYEAFALEPEAAAPAATAAPASPVAQSAPAAPPAEQVAAPAPTHEPEVAAVEAPQAAAGPARFALSESDLAAAISKISREVIERIVWEVVPDLAEVMIKEEIRKLKAGVKG